MLQLLEYSIINLIGFARKSWIMPLILGKQLSLDWVENQSLIRHHGMYLFMYVRERSLHDIDLLYMMSCVFKCI